MVEMLNHEVLEQQCLEDRCSKMIVLLSEFINKNSSNLYSFSFSFPEAEVFVKSLIIHFFTLEKMNFTGKFSGCKQ